ncbi:LOW QUALITY PROTEIN: ralBP1-associated Eps domain-containing protein 2 [Drosophila eugracilis]|uniref:LOW QUALITY PROTEIN: ralBP1-associated Eps domain-containing protein 2 n=1 Tax=Drosophila eugracilis TaxID=29029 RepID=UPI001BDAC9CA|nr:LOW QUALITY PROTEIN: ralBP1-associated Eps domain-containing protein 2 [Drosophila eugracilis]
MDVSLTEPETRFYSELFQCCDVEKTGKVPMLKATELFRSADIANETVIEITGLAGIPSTALHISRAQFYSCLKLIAAHQAAMPLRQELILATFPLPLPHFSWKEAITAPVAVENGLTALPPPPPTDRRNSLRRNSQQEQLQDTSDVPSTDSEVEQNESVDEATGHGRGTDGSGVVSSSSRENVGRRRGGGAGGGSPEAWSTNSDSPTPTNSVAERPWAQDTLWQGLLGDEHRQLLGTEEESSDRHSSDDEDNENELVTIYQITPEQREYYNKQFRTVQRDPHGLLSGQAARNFFEKSRIPVEELRHIWQLCDVTRDGALSLSEFTAAMHLVVLRRNNIPLPTSLPHCLHPNVLQAAVAGSGQGANSLSSATLPQEPPEADLLHLNDDDEDDHTDNTIIAGNHSGGSSTSKPRPNVPSDKNIMNLSSISTSSQASNSSRREATPQNSLVKNRSISNSPSVEKQVTGVVTSTASAVDSSNASSQWTKFSESPTTSAAPAHSTTGAAPVVAGGTAAPAASSPGLKPALFDMKRSAQDVVSNPQILHPVPLRVTPIGTAIASSAESSNDNEGVVVLREDSPKAISSSTVNNQSSGSAVLTGVSGVTGSHRDSSDLRAIQRPQAKKLPAKNSALPPPPQREPSIGSSGPNELTDPQAAYVASSLTSKKEPPPLPPPRPHRHARSSSLDLNKFKMGATGGAQQAEVDEQQLHSLPPAAPPPQAAMVPPTRITLQQAQQRVSAFEVYRKPQTPRGSQSPPQQPPPPAPAVGLSTQSGQLPSAEIFEKRVNAISDSLRHVSFKEGKANTTELLQRLREQNSSLQHLCNDLSDELLSVQTRKEEMRLKLEGLSAGDNTGRTSSSISAPVTANVTGGSSGSAGAGYTNV